MSGLLKLIEKQIATGEIRNRLQDQARKPGRCVVGGVAYGPCLLVSREFGSGGGPIARQVAERLGWGVFDAKLVEQVAEAAHVRQRLVESVDERVRSYWEKAWREVLPDGEMADRNYLRCLRELVLSLGHHGDVVIVGRGAQYLLPPACGLRVRVVAPLELRAERVADREEISLQQARSRAKQVDAYRTAFVRKIFRSDAGSPLGYDLVINTGQITIAGATEIVLASLNTKLGVRTV